ncbi:hypothetical protein BGX21_005932 [Mortierella sp. AD011]|nr:hypothetical protein BGX20_006559 [Mortierella sp. AD010]KAF9399599.1 hypothetical protein BGX21_005932 [Mortierella sp. AD011]
MNNQTASKGKHSGHTEEQRQPTNTQTEDVAPATSADIHAHSNDRSHHPEHRSSHQVSSGSISTSKRHSYNGGQSKTRPLIKNTTTGTKLANHGRRRRAKFVFGDQELEKEAHPDEEHLQQTPSIEDPSTDREQISQREQPGHPSGKQTPQENQDSGHGPNSETIPNVDRRNHPRRIEPLGATGRSGAGKAKTAEDSVSIGLIRPSGSALQQDQHPANGRQFKQTHTSDHRNDQRAVSLPDRENGPENPTDSASTSTAKRSCHIPRSNTSPSVERQPNYPMQPELSKRLSHLLHPSHSTTSLPSITRTISYPVLSTISPVQSISDDSDHHSEEGESATISALSAALKSEQPQTNPVVGLVSKFLNPYTTMRSRSHSNLSTLATSSPGTNNDMFGLNRHHQQQRSSSMGTSVYSPPPRANDLSPYLISRFLPNSPSQPSQPLLASLPRLVSSSTLTTSPTAITPPQQLPLFRIKRRRLPAGLQMTAAAYSPEGGSSTQDQVVFASSAPTTSTAPPRSTSPVSISSVYSSAEGRPQYQSSDPGNSISSPWNSIESMSRTQQKLMLQKECTQDDLDKHEIVRRGRAMREMDKIQKDYRCVRMYADPILDSLARCKAEQEIEQKLLQTQKDARLRADLQNSIASMSVKSM